MSSAFPEVSVATYQPMRLTFSLLLLAVLSAGSFSQQELQTDKSAPLTLPKRQALARALLGVPVRRSIVQYADGSLLNAVGTTYDHTLR